MKTEEINSLRTAWEDHFERRFPSTTPGETNETHDIRTRLMTYDGYIAGLVDSLLRGDNILDDSLYYRTDLADRLKAIVNNEGDNSTGKLAKDYLNYLDALHNLVSLARKTLS